MHVGVNLGIQRQYVPVMTLKQKSYPLLPIEDASFLNFIVNLLLTLTIIAMTLQLHRNINCRFHGHYKKT